MYQVTRTEIVNAAKSLEGVKYRHQGRNPATGLDCCGFVAEVLRLVDYPEIIDLEVYSRSPSDDTLINMMRLNLDEIEVADVQIGDVFLMKMFSARPRHVSIKVSETHLIHALKTISISRVIESPIRVWRSQIVGAFRLKGVV